MKNNIIIAVVLSILAFILGSKFYKNKKELQGEVYDYALQEGLNHVKSEADVTKKWFNQLKNSLPDLKKIWKF